MKICIIGAGAAGLISIKRAIELDCEVIAFELTKRIGGVWNYTDQVGKDKYGVDIHSSMYKNLRTNLPIEIMCYPNEPFRNQKDSFVSSEEVLKYYQTFDAKYDLKKHVKFEHQVVRVRPLTNGWEVIVKDLATNIYATHNFDGVIVCSGHFHSANVPEYEGCDVFQGKQFHSHDYRCSEPFKDERVLVIGGSFSGVDIVQESSRFAKNVTWSHHLGENRDSRSFRENVEQKTDVARLTPRGAEFVDGSFSEFTVVIYCTGYEYKFPFLSVDCGISTEDRYVKPLFMHCLSINRPTLGIIGLSNLIVPNQMFDLQAQFCLAFMTGRKILPSKSEMMKEYENDVAFQMSRGFGGKKMHYLGDGVQDDYYIKLAERAGVEPIMPCVSRMHTQCLLNAKADLVNFRNIKFRVIDENNFEMSKLE